MSESDSIDVGRFALLRQEEEMLEAACDFADIWVWALNIETGRIHCLRKLRDDFGLPEYLDNYPDSWLELDFIHPDFKELYRAKVNSMQAGSPSEEFEVRLNHTDGSEH